MTYQDQSERCVICKRKTDGALFCKMSHFRIYEKNPGKYKNRLRIREALEDDEYQRSIDEPDEEVYQSGATGMHQPNDDDAISEVHSGSSILDLPMKICNEIRRDHSLSSSEEIAILHGQCPFKMSDPRRMIYFRVQDAHETSIILRASRRIGFGRGR